MKLKWLAIHVYWSFVLNMTLSSLTGTSLRDYRNIFTYLSPFFNKVSDITKDIIQRNKWFQQQISILKAYSAEKRRQLPCETSRVKGVY